METKAKWNSVIYKKQSTQVPSERWGHKFVKVHNQLLLFGGYGGLPEGQGKYLQDVWKFDLQTFQWEQLITTGSIPEARSNYTLHFNPQNQQIILFGGGADNKARFNTIHTLDIATLQWNQIVPEQTEEAPWERTYHTSEFYQNYLIVFGGEGVSNLDLDDLWAFDFNNKQWIKLEPKGLSPTRRRFPSSALVGSDFYLIGGCQDNYHVIGQLHRLSLLPLLHRQPQNLKWQLLISDNKLLKRWGQSVDVHDNSLFIFSGRMNEDYDSSDLIEYNCTTGQLITIDTQNKPPPPRRRHASVVVGNCLLVFGGYNSKYFNDFFFTKLPNTDRNCKNSNNIQIVAQKQYQMSLNKIAKSSEYIFVANQSQVRQLPTVTKQLEKNLYFKYFLKKKEILQLPSFCSIETFQRVHLALINGILRLSKEKNIEECYQIGRTLSYFCCQTLLSDFQIYLISKINPSNALTFLNFSEEISSQKLAEAAASAFLRQKSVKEPKQAITVLFSNDCQHQRKSLAIQVLSKTQKQLKFELTQTQIQQRHRDSISRTVDALKNIFSLQPQKKEEQKNHKEKEEKGCLFFFLKSIQKVISLSQAQHKFN